METARTMAASLYRMPSRLNKYLFDEPEAPVDEEVKESPPEEEPTEVKLETIEDPAVFRKPEGGCFSCCTTK